MKRVPESIIQPPPSIFSNEEELLKGVAKLDDGKRLVMILETTKLIALEKLEKISGIDENKEENFKTIEKQLLDEEQLVTFKIDKEDYAIKINFVQEITRMTEITRIPRAPYFIDGIVNLRGNIIPALNLRKLFEMNEKQVTDSTRIIIVDLNNKKTGIIVDEVSEVLRFEKNLIESSPDILSQGKTNKYIDGVGKIDNGNRMVIILKLDQILNFNNI